MENFEAKKTKEELLRDKIEEVSKYGDGRGQEMDAEVIEAVALMNLLGFNTSSSCGGHVDQWNIRNPYIRVAAPDKPMEYVGERLLKKIISKKYSITDRQVEYREPAEKEYWHGIKGNNYKRTNEWQEWDKKNEILYDELMEFLEEYRGLSEKQPNFHRRHGLAVDVVFGEDVPTDQRKKRLTADEKEILERKLGSFQEEVKLFTEFLKKKYFEENSA